MNWRALELASLGIAGTCATIGGFLWTGIYVGHHGKLGIALFIVSVVFLAMFIGLSEEADQSQDRPPNEPARDWSQEKRPLAHREQRELLVLHEQLQNHR